MKYPEGTIECFLKINPPTKTQQEHRIGRRKNGSYYTYEDAKLREARLTLRDALMEYLPKIPIEGAILLMTRWIFPKGKHEDGAYRISKPDTDNLSKMLKDEMTKVGFWKDDAQVVHEIIEKRWGNNAGIYIVVQKMEGVKC